MAKRKRPNSNKPSAKRYISENRRFTNKLRRVRRCNGEAAAARYAKEGRT